RAGMVHRSGIVHFHARESSTAQESQNSTRGSRPPLKNSGIPRAGVVHRSGIAESHALEASTARELQNPARGNRLPLRNSAIPRAGTLYDNLSPFHPQFSKIIRIHFR